MSFLSASSTILSCCMDIDSFSLNLLYEEGPQMGMVAYQVYHETGHTLYVLIR